MKNKTSLKIIFGLFMILVVSINGQENHTCQTTNLLSNSYERPNFKYYEELTIETTNFVIHYTLTGPDAVTQTYADSAAIFAEESWQVECTQLNWTPPPSDNELGGNSKYDIYLIGIVGYGWTRGDLEEYQNENNGVTHLLASIDLTFDELKVTIAHEFNHALQFGLTGYGSNFHFGNAWIYESTATWMEDIVYDEVNDWINLYLFDINNEGVRTPLSHPHYPITQEDDDFMYANALFIHFLSEWKNANDLIRQIWLRNAYVGGDPVENIDYVLSNYYGTSLPEALEEYAVWRYFTGSRDDGNHFEEASSYPELNIQNSHSSLPIQSQMTPSAPGGASYVSFQINDIGIDLDYDGYGISNNYQWTGKTISILDNSDTFIDELLFDENNDGNIIYDLNGIQEIVFFSTVMKGYEEELNIALNYSATLPPNTNICFWNEYVDTNLGGTLSVNSTTVESGQSLPLIDVFQYSAKTNNERFVNTSTLKHNNWNQNSSIFFLGKSFDPTEALSQRAKFLPLNYAKLSIKVDGIDVGLGKIKFNDPWYLKSDGTQSGMNDFIEFDAPYEPTGKEGETNGGVFLDQNPSYDPLLPGYKVSISPTQTINYNGSSHQIYFNDWSHNGKADFEDANITTTPVVFTEGGAEVYANHKGSLLSSTENALSGTGQRKMVKAGSSHHLIYGSMNMVWYEKIDGSGSMNFVRGEDSNI